MDINNEQKDYEYANAFHIISMKDSVIGEFQSNIQSIKTGIDNGLINPLDAFIVYNELKKLLDNAKKEIDEIAQVEADKYTEKTINYSPARQASSLVVGSTPLWTVNNQTNAKQPRAA